MVRYRHGSCIVIVCRLIHFLENILSWVLILDGSDGRICQYDMMDFFFFRQIFHQGCGDSLQNDWVGRGCHILSWVSILDGSDGQIRQYNTMDFRALGGGAASVIY